MAIADVNGSKVAYSDTGGDGAVVVLSHGYLMDRTMWEPQIEALVPEFRVITWDSRGFGGTFASGPFTYWDCAGDLLGLLDHLGVGSAVFGGMSQGGFISMRAALLAPKRVRGLMLFDTQARAEHPSTLSSYDILHATWMEQGPGPVRETIAFLLLGPGAWPKYFAAWAALDRSQFNLTYRCLMDRDGLTERLGEITCAALITHGVDDAAIPIARAEEIRDLLGGPAKCIPVTGGAHASIVTHAEILNPLVLSFLRGLPLGTT